MGAGQTSQRWRVGGVWFHVLRWQYKHQSASNPMDVQGNNTPVDNILNTGMHLPSTIITAVYQLNKICSLSMGFVLHDVFLFFDSSLKLGILCDQNSFPNQSKCH